MFSGSKKFNANKTILSGALCCSMLFSSLTLAAPRTVDDNASNNNGSAEVARARVVGTVKNNRYATKNTVLTNASIIRNVSITKATSGMLAVIELDGQAKFNHFTLPSPYRLVVDVQNVTNTTPPVIEVGDFGIKRIRVGKLEDMVRIVFDAEKQQPYEITSEGTQIRIAFGNVNPAILATATSSPVTKPTVAPTPNKLTPSVTKVPSAVVGSAPKTIAPLPQPTASAKINEAPKVVSYAATKPLAEKTAEPVTTQQNKLSVAVTPIQQAVILPSAITPKTKVARIKPSVTNFASKNLLASTDNINDVPPPAKKVAAPTPTPTVAPNSGSKLTRKAALEAAKIEAAKAIQPQINKPGSSVVTATPQPIVPVATTLRPREVSGPLPSQAKIFRASDYLRADFQGEPINLDLRSSTSKVVDIRDFLRFISDTYKVNFVLDQSVKEIPITVTLQGIPWNRAMDAILKANRLGVKVEGDILRVLTAEAITQEDKIYQEQVESRQKAGTLVTKMIRLNYARAGGASAGGAGGNSGGMAAAASGAPSTSGGAGGAGGGNGLDGIIKSSLSPRGTIQADQRTNILIVKDLPENIAAVEEIIRILDVPEPQVEIEARIVIANRNFARALGVQLSAVALNPSRGSIAGLGTLPGGTSGTVPNGIPGGVAGAPQPSGALGVSSANTVLSLTTGIFGTAQISAILSANESKGNVKTISSPRITAQNNQKANIVNGVQIPVQTESNNTLTVSFVTAALSLEITPQITESGYVNLHVVASNDSVNTAFSTSAAPGINKQSAETTVLVPDGGTTIIGGINVDVESNTQQRTPGISSIPGLGELFKRRSVTRQTDEILFFITPRIYRPFGTPTTQAPTMDK